MKKILFSMLFVPSVVLAQQFTNTESDESATLKTSGGVITKKAEDNKGVEFDETSSWQQIKDSARKTNKFIFLDCFATWCGPCKQMDRTVYTDVNVGYVLKKLIPVKVQLDSSKNDGDRVRSWYSDAHRIMAKYKIAAFPTYLFMSPDGEIVHEGLGFLKPTEFIDLVEAATDPRKQFYTLLRYYFDGNKNYSQLPSLIESANNFNLKDTAQLIAADYIHNYLDQLPDAALFTKQNLVFLDKYLALITPKDKVCGFYFNDAATIDSIVNNKGYTHHAAYYIVYKEEMASLVKTAKESKKEPDWKKIGESVKAHFGAAYEEGTVLEGKINYYKSILDWKHYCKYFVEKLERDSIENSPKTFWGAFALNNCAWDIFQHSNNKKELQHALIWSDLAVQIGKPNALTIDTKANLLYKLGRKKDALALEAKAVELDPKNNNIQEVFQKMHDGKPTW
jgi:thioredoxin-related protein